MVAFSGELKGIKVLLKEDVVRLRTYIQAKYPDYDQAQRASVLANTIHRIVDRQIQSLPLSQQKTIKEKLFQDTLSGKQEGVFLYDIFQASMSLSYQEEGFLESLCAWVNGHVMEPISKDQLLEYGAQSMGLQEQAPSIDRVTGSATEAYHENHSPYIAEIPLERYKPFYQALFWDKLKFSVLMLLLLLLLAGNQVLLYQAEQNALASVVSLESETAYYPSFPQFPQELEFKEINEDKLKAYLDSRHSILAQEPYFSAIINSAKELHLNPHVLFAIAGHEQGFVPEDHPSAVEIANNPFNVFSSWQKYNTNIEDSAAIAARTVINLARDLPEGMDPFQWINRKYAEDQNWWKGVRSIFDRLEEESS